MFILHRERKKMWEIIRLVKHKVYLYNVNENSQGHKYSHHVHLDKMPNLITSLSPADKHKEYTAVRK